MSELMCTMQVFLHLFLDYTNNCHMVICRLELFERSSAYVKLPTYNF